MEILCVMRSLKALAQGCLEQMFAFDQAGPLGRMCLHEMILILSVGAWQLANKK